VLPVPLGEGGSQVRSIACRRERGGQIGHRGVRLRERPLRQRWRLAIPGKSAAMVRVVRGARAVAQDTVPLAARSQLAELALVNGQVGVIVAPGGRLRFALSLTVEGDKITDYTVIADPERLSRLSLAVLE
jgi:hypothetical protein